MTKEQKCKHSFFHEILKLPIKIPTRIKGGGYDKELIEIPHIEIYCTKCGEHKSFEKERKEYTEAMQR